MGLRYHRGRYEGQLLLDAKILESVATVRLFQRVPMAFRETGCRVSDSALLRSSRRCRGKFGCIAFSWRCATVICRLRRALQ
nr:hypothetical protein [Mycobacterium uberis]